MPSDRDIKITGDLKKCGKCLENRVQKIETVNNEGVRERRSGIDLKGPLWEGSLEKFCHGFGMLGFIKGWFASPARDTNPMLLIVAENKITQETIRRDFESLGCKVIPALTAKSAWHSLETGTLPDLIILDFVLSDEDGPTFFRRLSLDKRFSSVPILALPFNLTPDGHKTLNGSPAIATSIFTTPYSLLFSVAQALRKYNVRLPIPFREKLRCHATLITDDINP